MPVKSVTYSLCVVLQFCKLQVGDNFLNLCFVKYVGGLGSIFSINQIEGLLAYFFGIESDAFNCLHSIQLRRM